MDLQKLYDFFEIKLQKQKIEKIKPNKKEKVDNKNNEVDPTEAWDSKILPPTEYTKTNSLKNKQKIEELQKTEISTRKLVKIMHATDIEILKRMDANDLIKYDGSNKTQNIVYMINKNTGTQNIFNSLSFSDLKKAAKECELLKNYNLIFMIVNAMQTKELTDKDVETVTFYKKLIDGDLEQSTLSILPFPWILKDCADSNCNVKSTVASIRFCKIVEKLNQMQAIESQFEPKEKHRQIIYSKIYVNLYKNKEVEEEIVHDSYLYLVI